MRPVYTIPHSAYSISELERQYIPADLPLCANVARGSRLFSDAVARPQCHGSAADPESPVLEPIHQEKSWFLSQRSAT